MTQNENIALSRSHVREIDRRAIEEYGIPSVVLMENAGRNAAQFILSMSRPPGPVAIVCGGGNNGGDGFVIARHLANAGLPVELYLASDPVRLTGDAAINYRIVEKMALTSHPFDTAERIAVVRSRLHAAAVIVDAMLGTGFHGAIRPPLDHAIDAINESTGPIMVAIDVPSGLDCDTGKPAVPTVRAHHTVTFVARKIGFTIPGAQVYTGQIIVADIGAPVALIQEVASGRS